MNRNLKILVTTALIGSAISFVGCGSGDKEEVKNVEKSEIVQDIDEKKDMDEKGSNENAEDKSEHKDEGKEENQAAEVESVEETKSEVEIEKPPVLEKPEVEKPKPEIPKPVEPEIEKPVKPEVEQISYTISMYDAAPDIVRTKTITGSKEELQKPWSVFGNLKDFGSIVSNVSLISYSINSNNVGVINVSKEIYAGFGFGAESMMIEHLAKGFASAFKTNGSIVNVEGGAYATGHMEFGIDEVIR